MELKQIKCFYETCKYHSFSEAAEHLFMTQQGVSKTIRQLEKELGVPLFSRSAAGISLTPEGEYLKTRSEILLIGLDETVNHLHAMRQEHTLRLGLSNGMRLVLAEDLLERFTNTFPECSVWVTEGSDLHCEQDVRSGVTDLAITVAPVDESVFEKMSLFSEPVCVLVNRDNPLSKKDTLEFADLKGQKLILLDERNKCYTNIIRRCYREGIYPDIAFTVPELLSVLELCQSNQGIAFTLLCLENRLTYDRVHFLPLIGADQWELCMITRKGAKGNSALEKFRDYILMRNEEKTLSTGLAAE